MNNKQKKDQSKIIFQVEPPSYISCVKFCADGRKVAITTNFGRFLLCYLDSSGYNILKVLEKSCPGITTVGFSQTNTIWVGYENGSLQRFSIQKLKSNLETEKNILCSTPHSSRIVRICSNLEYIAVGEIHGLVSLWKNDRLIRLISHSNPISDLSWSVSHLHTLAITGGKVINFYNLFKQKITGQINSESEIMRVLWSSNTSEIVIVVDSPEEQLTLCSYPDLKMINSWSGHELTPTEISLTGNGETLVSAAPNEFIKVIVSQ